MLSSPRLSPRFNQDLLSRDPHWIEPQCAARPARGDRPVAQIERCRMAWAEQASCRNVSKAEIGLFVRTGAFACNDIALMPDHEHVEPGDADDGLCLQPAEVADRNPPGLVWADTRIIHRDRLFAHARSRSARCQRRTARCGRSRADRHGRTSRARQMHSARPAAPWCRHRECCG